MAEKILLREQIEDKYKWDLSKILKNDKAFDDLIDKTNKRMGKILEFKSKLKDKKALLECLNFNTDIFSDIVRVYIYAQMSLDENTTVAEGQARVERAGNLYSKFSVMSSFITPELSAMDEKYLEELVADKDFSHLDLTIKDIIRQKEHTLSQSEEKLLAESSDVLGMFSDIFNMTNNADIDFGEIENENGEMVEFSHSNYSVFLSSEDRATRKRAYERCYETFKKLIHTISTTYIGNVKKDVFLAKVRKFKSALDYAMFYENVDKIVYDNLLNNTKKALPTLHDYIGFRKKEMDLKELRFYDLYVALVENKSLKCEYEEAYDLVKKALTPLGADYQELLERAFSDGWIDVYHNKGKRSGAYSNSMYGVDPYVLLNYEKTASDIFTIAHELGHAMHSYYSNEANCIEKADYTIFVAEVASTVNEVLLLKYLINTTNDVSVKKFCLNYFLDMLRTTWFRQTMFAEFEFIAHNLSEKDTPLTQDVLTEQYKKLNEKYYGKEIEIDDFIKYEWLRIPHFYRAFYVYKYSTGIISAITIADNILNEGEKAVEKYKQFLRSGGTDRPTELLKIAGVDLTKDEPFEKAFKVFKETLKELKELK